MTRDRLPQCGRGSAKSEEDEEVRAARTAR